MSNEKNRMIKWNTGAHYTAQGQRIAACQVDDTDVIMIDIDRGLEYRLPNCQLEQSVIMHRYLYNKDCQYVSCNDSRVKALEAFLRPLVDLLTSSDKVTSLIAYVLYNDGTDRWQRVKKTHKLCGKLGIDASSFFERVYETAKAYGIDTKRMQSAVAKLS